MNEEETLLHAICADPDEDTPRLVYADWLDEHGDPERAELIRLQVEGSRLRESDEEAWARCRRLRDLFEGDAAPRKREFFPTGNAKKADFKFERGLPALLRLTDPTVNEFAALTCLPTLRWLIVQGRYELTPFVLELIVGLPCLDVLCVWDVQVSAAALDVLERLPPWAVFSIDVAGGDGVLRAFHARRLARFEQLLPAERRAGAIRSLRFAHDIFPPHPGELVKVIRLPWLSKTDDELVRLSAIPEVEEVHITSGPVTAAQLAHLARFPNLTTVNLGHCEYESLAPLAACPKLQLLQTEWESYKGDALRSLLEGGR